LTLLFTAVSFAKFATSGSGDDDAVVASFAVDAFASGTSSFSLGFGADDALASNKADTFNDTDSCEYAVTVRNYEGTAVSEVALSYTVIITVDGGLPDGVTMKMNGMDPVSATGGVYTFSGFDPLPASDKTESSNILTITAASKNITTDISALKLDVSVCFEQID